MLVAIFSDSHDHIVHLRRAVLSANEKGAEVILHCGDLISPFMLKHLALFSGPIHLVYGNNVGDQHLISSRCSHTFPYITQHGILAEIKLDGLKFAMNHYPELARGLAQSGEYDIVCCGHNHICKTQQIGQCLFINPGDLLGKDIAPGYVLLNTSDLSVRRITVGEPMDLEEAYLSTEEILFQSR